MATERKISSLSPPTHLTTINWNDPQYRSSVVACLVQGVYSIGPVVPESQGKVWWEDFHFTLHETLINECDRSIYGAIFKYNLFDHYNNYRNIPGVRLPPRYVIAFRGTMLNKKTWFSDARLDIRIVFDKLHRDKRFLHAMQTIHSVVAKHSDASVWLAGHSLGAGLALLAGKAMAKAGFSLETYVFNPPISAVPLELLTKCKMLKGGIRVAECLLKAGVASLFKDLEGQEDDPSVNIASWIPYLHVNSRDVVCSEYIGYFENKMFMSEIGLSKVERIAAKNPLRSLFVGHGGTLSSEPLHLLPSAYMTVNKNGPHNTIKAHGLHHWWDPLLHSEYVFYQFRS